MGARADTPEMRCVHCSATETPLWRAGPAGPKTLCNACGVRWKKTGSVIPRAKRPTPPSSAPQTAHQPPAHPAVRKRARVATPPPPDPPTHPPPASPPDPRAAAAAAAATNIQAPKPISVFRISDAGRSKYESVFTGLMAVNRAPKPDEKNPAGAPDDPLVLPRVRTRTQTTKGTAFFGEFAPPQRPPPLDLPNSPLPPPTSSPPCPSPPPVERPQQQEEETTAGGPIGGGVYVTEVHAPSPSPSPPPLPRVKRTPEGGGFTLMMSVRQRKDPM